MLKKSKLLLGLFLGACLSMAFIPIAAFAADLDVTSILSSFGALKSPQGIAFTLFAVAGVLVHVELDIRKGAIQVADSGSWLATLFKYMLVSKPMASLSMLVGAAALGATYLAVTPQPISWVQLLMAGATAGYTSDSLFNRS